ncbi:26S protease regulatory subunit 8 [Capsicum chinense]|nr:26S protease regulatory subunit 8 [Capsicum chinense]
MASVDVGRSRMEAEREEICSAKATKQGEGLRQYYMQHIHDLQLQVRHKTHNLNRLEAQRNELNSKVRMLKEELQLLQEPGSYVGEVVKVMGKSKVLVKVHPEGKYVVDIDKTIDITKITPSTRVALRNDSYVLHLILPSKVDPLVNLMKVEKVPDSTYDMIGGLDQQIKEIKEVIELPIKHPELFESLGIAQPKGVLLYGPPGTGKTLLARAVAHHTDCTFIRVSGSELVQKYIGEGSRMVRELFVMAREHAPSIIFMDEIDSIGSARMESGSGNGDSEVQRTMLELLNQLDGFEASNKIKASLAIYITWIYIAYFTTLLRPGRIDRKIEFPNPNEESRFDILKIHSRKMNLMRGIDLKKIAEKMNGASGAELKAVCTEAGMFALRERRVHVTQEDFEMAVAKVMKKETEKNMSLRKLWK